MGIIGSNPPTSTRAEATDVITGNFLAENPGISTDITIAGLRRSDLNYDTESISNAVRFKTNNAIRGKFANNGDFDINIDTLFVKQSKKFVGIGDIENANMAQGLTINQGANDDEILALKSSDIAHGITDETETDSFGFIRKFGPTSGGLSIKGVTELALGLELVGLVTTADDTDTSSSNGAVQIRSSLKSGAGIAAHSAANILAIRNHATTRLLLKEDGQMHITNTTLVALDNHDDIQLARDLQLATIKDGKLGVSKESWDNLVKVKALSSTGDFQIIQGMNAVSLGAISQLFNGLRELAKEFGISEERLLEMTTTYA